MSLAENSPFGGGLDDVPCILSGVAEFAACNAG
jgi:hypothetical protein